MAFWKKEERLTGMFCSRKREGRRDGQDGHEDEGGEESEEDEKKGDGRKHARDIGFQSWREEKWRYGCQESNLLHDNEWILMSLEDGVIIASMSLP